MLKKENVQVTHHGNQKRGQAQKEEQTSVPATRVSLWISAPKFHANSHPSTSSVCVSNFWLDLSPQIRSETMFKTQQFLGDGSLVLGDIYSPCKSHNWALGTGWQQFTRLGGLPWQMPETLRYPFMSDFLALLKKGANVCSRSARHLNKTCETPDLHGIAHLPQTVSLLRVGVTVLMTRNRALNKRGRDWLAFLVNCIFAIRRTNVSCKKKK